MYWCEHCQSKNRILRSGTQLTEEDKAKLKCKGKRAEYGEAFKVVEEDKSDLVKRLEEINYIITKNEYSIQGIIKSNAALGYERKVLYNMLGVQEDVNE